MKRRYLNTRNAFILENDMTQTKNTPLHRVLEYLKKSENHTGSNIIGFKPISHDVRQVIQEHTLMLSVLVNLKQSLEADLSREELYNLTVATINIVK